MNGNSGIGFDGGGKPSSRPGRLAVAMVLTALIALLAGCSGGGAGGEGSVDIARSKEASPTSPAKSKGAALRERGTVADVQKTKKGRR